MSGSINMYDEVLEVLDKLRPFLQRDGGDVELVDVEEGIEHHFFHAKRVSTHRPATTTGMNSTR
jgi:hypothetical protein